MLPYCLNILHGISTSCAVPPWVAVLLLSPWVAAHAATDCFPSAGHVIAVPHCFRIVTAFFKYTACTQKPEDIVCCLQGFNMAVRNVSMQLPDSAVKLDQLIQQRINGSLKVSALKLLSCTVQPLHCQMDAECHVRMQHVLPLSAQSMLVWHTWTIPESCSMHLEPGLTIFTRYCSFWMG